MADKAIKRMKKSKPTGRPDKYLFIALEAVMILLEKPTDYAAMKAQMQDVDGLIKQLEQFQKNTISEEVIEELDSYTD